MSFKLNLTLTTSFALPNHISIYVHGRDASVFLQSQLMNDVNALIDGHWQYTGILNAQGRVLALFQLAKQNAEQFFIILPSLDAHWLINHLNQFKFRAKLNFSVLENLYAHGLFCTDDIDSVVLPSFTGDIEQGFTCQIPNAKANRILKFTNTLAENNSQAADQWHCLDMSIGWVWIDSSLQNIWTPQMLSLQNLPAFSLKKGCYPGQEIVARTHYLGKSKRHLQAISGYGLRPGQVLFQNQHEIGKIVNANLQGNYAMAVLPIEINTDWQIRNNDNEVTLL